MSTVAVSCLRIEQSVHAFRKRAMSLSCAVGLGALMGVTAAAAAPALDVKAGQWEVTSQRQMQGSVPIPQSELDRLTPEQRAALENMNTDLRKRHTSTLKSCLTQKDIDQNQGFEPPHDSGMKCTSKMKRSGRDVDASYECTEEGRHESVKIHYRIKDREHVEGTSAFTMTDGNRTATTHATMSARWLGPVCAEDQ
jgi:Protein of unknown function (DUF3617)